MVATFNGDLEEGSAAKKAVEEAFDWGEGWSYDDFFLRQRLPP